MDCYLARRVGGRFKYLWLATLFHGIVVECVCFLSPDIDNYWHSQTSVVFLARRLPIHIMMLCMKRDDLSTKKGSKSNSHELPCLLLQTRPLSTTRPLPYLGSSCPDGQSQWQVNKMRKCPYRSIWYWLWGSWTMRRPHRLAVRHHGGELPSLDMVGHHL